MKLNHTVVVFDNGNVVETEGWIEAYKSYSSVLAAMVNPVGSPNFKIKAKSRNLNGKWERNGVGPLKQQFLDLMKSDGWQFERPLRLDDHIAASIAKHPWLTYPQMTPFEDPLHSRVGNLDFWIKSKKERIAIEWETGNISSSHRSLNKLCMALLAGLIDVCVLIVPSRKFYYNLTDRIGNWTELSPYLAFWKQVGVYGVKRGLLVITTVEHDEISDSIGYLVMGPDGRSAQGKKKSRAENQ